MLLEGRRLLSLWDLWWRWLFGASGGYADNMMFLASHIYYHV